MDHLVGWLNDTTVKTVLLIVGNFLLWKFPAFVNKAIPSVTLVFSSILSTLALMFPTVVPGTHPAMFMATSVAGMPLYATAGFLPHVGSWLWNTLAPVAFSIAAHSGPKNTAEWAQLGVGLFWPDGKPPVK